jgi:CRISPR/Cas system-associated exonuclease Cas4 (RecB family)
MKAGWRLLWMKRTGLKEINVSDLSRYDYCPRAVYLTKVLTVKPQPTKAQLRGMIEHAVLKELSLREAKILKAVEDSDDVESILQGEIQSMLSDIPYIYGEWWGEGHSEILDEMEPDLVVEGRLLGEKIKSMIADMGLEKSLEYVTPWKTEYTMKSDLLMMKGRVDKIMRRETLLPLELKTGNPPENIRQGHRLQVCGYSMLLEEELGEKIPYGLVEYARVHETRPVLNTEKLRRQVIYIRDAVFDLLGGDIPDVCPHGLSKKCDACSLMEECFKI